MSAPVDRPEGHPARPPVRLAIMGGHQLTRYGMRLALETQPDFVVTADYADVQVPHDPAECLADVVLVDPVDCNADAPAMVRDLRRSGCPADVVVVTDTSCDCACIDRVLAAGASGIVLKDGGPEQLAHALRSVSAGYAVAPVRVADALCGPGCTPATSGPPAGGPDTARIGLLTERERDVLRSLMTGASNAEIARSLHLGVGTVKAHVQHLLAKLEVRNRQQAVIYAFEVGFGPVEGRSDAGSVPPEPRGPDPVASRRRRSTPRS